MVSLHQSGELARMATVMRLAELTSDVVGDKCDRCLPHSPSLTLTPTHGGLREALSGMLDWTRHCSTQRVPTPMPSHSHVISLPCHLPPRPPSRHAFTRSSPHAQITVSACASALLVALVAYLTLRPRPTYLLDFEVSKPPERCEESVTEW